MLDYIMVDEDGFVVAIIPRYSVQLAPLTPEFAEFRQHLQEYQEAKGSKQPPDAFKVFLPFHCCPCILYIQSLS